jgi:hypothetical protein
MFTMAHALLHLTMAFLTVAPAPTPTPVATLPTDTTGISNAFTGIARLGAGFIGGVLSLTFVIEGYHYLTTDEGTRGIHAKRAISTVIGGVVLIVLGVTLAPQIVHAIIFGN